MKLTQKIKNVLGKFPLNKKMNALRNEHARIFSEIDQLKINQGKILSEQMRSRGTLSRLGDAGFKIFSQWDDDGIIQYLIHHIEIQEKTFIEFGVENYIEANTRFLLENNNWSGLVMDSSEKNIASIKNSPRYWKYNLAAKAAFIDTENIDKLISDAGFRGKIGILSIDIDGNDYYVWDAITAVNPTIVIAEYNAAFGKERAITVPYDKHFVRENAHYSHLYYGASLRALCHLAEKKGYSFVGCENHGANAYFVRKDALKNLQPVGAAEGYVASQFRQSRDKNGSLDYTSPSHEIEVMRGLPVLNVLTGKIEKI